jgi:hypothetical protein
MVAAAKGYELILTTPSSIPIERRVMLQAFGAKVVVDLSVQLFASLFLTYSLLSVVFIIVVVLMP